MWGFSPPNAFAMGQIKVLRWLPGALTTMKNKGLHVQKSWFLLVKTWFLMGHVGGPWVWG